MKQVMEFSLFIIPRGLLNTKLHKNSPAPEKRDSVLSASEYVKTLKQKVLDGPDVIRTHDLPVISRAHHRAMLRAQKIALNLP